MRQVLDFQTNRSRMVSTGGRYGSLRSSIQCLRDYVCRNYYIHNSLLMSKSNSFASSNRSESLEGR